MWIKIKSPDNKIHIINDNTIMKMMYNNETNMTVIDFTRSAYPPIYVVGNILKEFQTAIKNDSKIISLGE